MFQKPLYLQRIPLLLLLLVPGRSAVFAQQDYDDFTVSVLTYSPGEELYSVFGHSAIRVKSRDGQTDQVYNYGTFDFDDPKFYLNFVRGNLIYRLSRVPYSYTIAEMEDEKRYLIETPLNLTVDEKERLIQFLQVNYLPEKREYHYEFLYNNCSTKILEVIDFSTNYRTVYNPMVVPQNSFRELLDSYLKSRPLTNMGIDLMMGFPADKTVMGTEAAFLPDYLHLLIKNARIATREGNSALSKPDISNMKNAWHSDHQYFNPGWVLWPLVLIMLISLILGSYLGRILWYIHTAVAILSASAGIIILLFWLFTNHFIFRFNTDLLWANPLILFFVFRRKNKGINRPRLYSIGLIALALLAILGAFSALFIERNSNLTAIACIVLFDLLHRYKNISNQEEQDTLSFLK